MDIKIRKEKAPEIKFKKEAEISIHKKKLIAVKEEDQAFFHKKERSDFFGNIRMRDRSSDDDRAVTEKWKRSSRAGIQKTEKDKKMAAVSPRHEESGKRSGARPGQDVKDPSGKKPQEFRDRGQAGRVDPDKNSLLTGREFSLPAGSAPADPISPDIMHQAGVISNREAKKRFQRSRQVQSFSETPKIQPGKSGIVRKGVQKGGRAVLTQVEGGEEANEALSIISTAGYPVSRSRENRQYVRAEKKLKVKRTDGKISSKQYQKELTRKKKGIKEKQKKQAVRQRKMQYVIDKLTGSENQDSLGKAAKDILRIKASAVMVKVAKYVGALLAPLFGMLLIIASAAAVIVLLFYCSPLGAFMQNPSDELPSIQEVLSGYYMEFNQNVAANAGEDGAVSYLHEENGNYVSNYMDTLMVYMVQYGTGDLGVVMDEQHQNLLKEIFDEMNTFENTTVTTTIQAGESLGNVVTSAYCSCPICCGSWSGGPTASGVMPTADHTLAVDAYNPFVPLGTHIIMNGIEYVVEDTGNFDRYGVQFDIYFDNHAEATSWGHQTLEAFLADGDENTISVMKRGSYVKNMNYEDYIELGKLTEEQEELLREVMSEDFRSEIPSFGVGSDVANLALTKVGCRYSQEHKYEEGYYDCSSLVQRCYAEFGINLPSVASTQGQYIVEHGLEVTEDMLEPGDLIFYSYENNGEFRNISHVAIYIGNGRMVHAANTARGVVNDPFNPSNIGLYGRPSLGQ